ncbi:MAG: hypothetical protein KAT05_17240 [Spirochaetes bacterium]|nr:hypothetical protein [Spirochaetota bacterium]
MNIEIFFITFFLLICVWIIIIFLFIFPRFIYKKSQKKIDKKTIEEIENSSNLLFKQNNGGIIGFFYFTAAVLDVKIFNKGLIIKPLFYKKAYLLKSEIINIEDWKGITVKGLKIEHSSEILKSPIVIYTSIPDKIKQILL